MRRVIILLVLLFLSLMLLQSVSFAQICSFCTPTPIPRATSLPTPQATQPNGPIGDKDTDGDGTPDVRDACIYDGGPDSNNGCPQSSQPTQMSYIPPTLPDLPLCAAATGGAEGVNVRSKPSSDSAVLAILNPSSIYNIVLTFTNAEATWSLVQTETVFGWARADLLRTGGTRCDFVPGIVAPDDVEVALLLPAVQAAREAARRASAVDPQPNSIVYLFDEETDLFLGAVLVDENGNQFDVPGLWLENSDPQAIKKAVLFVRKQGSEQHDYLVIELQLDLVAGARPPFAYDPAFAGGVRVAVGDVNGDGVGLLPGMSLLAGLPDDDSAMEYKLEDILISSYHPAGGPHVKVFDGRTFADVPDNDGFVVDFAPEGGFVLTYPTGDPGVPRPTLLIGLPKSDPVIGFVGLGALDFAIPKPDKPVYPTWCEAIAEDGSQVYDKVAEGYPKIHWLFFDNELKTGDQVSVSVDINNINLPEGTQHSLTMEWATWIDDNPNDTDASPVKDVFDDLPDPQNTPATFTTIAAEYADQFGFFALSADTVWLSELPEGVKKLFTTTTIECVPAN